MREVQLPLALPSIMVGVNQVIMLSLSMVVIAGFVGAAGLGAVVVCAVTQLDIAPGFESGLAVVYPGGHSRSPHGGSRRARCPCAPRACTETRVSRR